MKESLKKWLVLAVVFSAFTISSAAPTVYFDFNGDAVADPSIGPIATGSSFSANIFIDGINGPNDGKLISMGLQFTYDPAQIHVDSLDINTIWLDVTPPSGPEIDNTSGLAEMIGGTLGDGFTGTILLGTAQFTCMSQGISDIILDELHPTSPLFDSFVSNNLTVFDQIIDFGETNVTQTPIPLPSTLSLTGIGLLGLAKVRRKIRG